MTGNYFGGIKLGKQLAEKAREVALEREEAESRIDRLERRIELARTLGLSAEVYMSGLQRARQLFDSREYRDSIAASIQSFEAATTDINSMFTSRIASTSSMMRFLTERGSDTGQLQTALDNVKPLLQAEKYDDAEAALRGIWQKEEKTLAEIFSHEFSAVQKALMEAKLYGGNVDGVDQALSDARNEITANNVENAFHLLEQGSALIASQLKVKADDSLKKLSQKVELSKELGLDTDAYSSKLENLRSLPADQKFGEIRQMLDSLNTEIDRKLRRAFDMRLKTVRSDLQDRTLPSSFTSGASSSLKEVEAKIEKDDYEAAHNGLAHIESELEKAKYDYIARILFNGKKYITIAVKSGTDLSPVNEHLNNVRELMKKRRFHEAIEAAEEANRAAMRLSTLTSDAEDRVGKLDAEFQALVSHVSNSVDISIRYADVKKKYETKDLDGFLADSDILLKDIDSMLENFATGQIDFLDRSISALEYLGGETLEINKRLGSAVSFIKNREFVGALNITSALEKDVEVKLKDLDQAWASKARRAADASTGEMKERLGKMMIWVTDLESKGENYRSASVAKDVVDWATKGNVYRVRSLVERSRRLQNVVPEVTSSSALNMLEAAQRNAEVDTESALNTAGEAHDILYSLLNDYFTREMGSLMEMVSTCRRKRVEIGYGYTLISRARAALKFEDFEAAAKMSSLARQEIQRRLKQVEDIEADLANADRLMSEAKKGNADTGEIQKLLSDAKESLKRFDYVQARKEISEALAREEKDMAANLAAREIMEFKSLLAVAAELGIQKEQLDEKKEYVLKLMRERKHYDALQSARSLSSELSGGIRSSLVRHIDEIAADTAQAEMDGLDIHVVESGLEKARSFLSSGQFSDCYSTVTLARDELGLVRNAVSNAVNVIGKADSTVMQLEELGLFDPGPSNLLKQAKNLLKNDQHLLALETAQKCLESCSSQIRTGGPKLLEQYAHSIYSCVGNDEIDAATETVNGAASLISGDPDEAAAALMNVKGLSERLALQEEMARRTLEVLRKRTSGLIDGGIASNALHSEIAAVDELLAARNYRAVIEKGLDVEQLIEDLTASSERAKQRMFTLEDRLAGYEEMGLEIDECRSMAKSALELISTGRLAESVARMTECEASAERILHEACITKAALVRSAGGVAMKLGLNTDGVKDSYDEMIVEGDMAAVYSQASRKLEEIAPLVSSNLRGRLEGALKTDGISQSFASELRRQFEDLIASKRFDTAYDFVAGSVGDIKSNSSIVAEIGALSKQFTDVVTDLRKTGISVRAFDARFKSCTRDVSRENLEALKRLVDEMRALRAEYSPRLVFSGEPSKWGPQLKITNSGKVVALDALLSIKGGTETKVEKLGNLKPGESRTLNLPTTIHGETSISSKATNPVDGSELRSARTFMVDGNSIRLELSCSSCKGRIREGAALTDCSCGRTYHEQCARRTPVCACGIRLVTN